MASSQRPRLFSRVTRDDARVLPDLLREETVGGLIMAIATVAALIWANVTPGGYAAVRGVHLGPLTIHEWAADGLLTLFFFVSGLELKREFISGSLSSPSRALVPIVAAGCGMVVPALIYLTWNTQPGGHPHGWAIPMATDIAFAVAILSAVSKTLPTSLRAFLLTLAIVDDLGAIIVIAVVFTTGLQFAWLGVALACALVWWILQRRRVNGWWWYAPLFALAWWAMHASGVHATIAGVLLGLVSRSDAREDDDPVDRWQHFWHPISAGFVVPVFALMSAGVTISRHSLAALFTEPIGLGILLGLVLGKPIGVFGGSWLTARFTRAELAEDLRWRHVFAVSILAGVGFTVALFVSELSFSDEAHIELAKAAVLVASTAAAVLGAVALRLVGGPLKASSGGAGD